MKTNDSVLSYLTTELVVRALPESTVQDAVLWMAQAGTDVIMVESGDGLQGIFTGHDLIQRVVGVGKDPARTRLDSVMSREVITLAESADSGEAIRLMELWGFHHLPITDEKRRVTAIVSALDLLKLRNRHLTRENTRLTLRSSVVEPEL
jgi:CBS domain-containing protein